MGFQNVPNYSFKAPVATVALLPTVGNNDGDARVALDTHYLYVWNATLSSWVSADSGQVVGPGSSTNTAIAKWNGTSGTTLSNSGVLINSSNQVINVVGSIATPSIVFSGALTTGFYQFSSDQFGFSTSGRDALRIGFDPFFAATTLTNPQTDPLYSGLFLTSSDSTVSGAIPGTVSLWGGSGTVGNTQGGTIQFVGGAGFGSSSGGPIVAVAGNGGATGGGGIINLLSGSGGSTSGNGGGFTAGSGGATGAANTTGTTLLQTSSATNSSSGAMTLRTGNSTTNNSGSIAITAGTANTSGKTAGSINLQAGPSSAGTPGVINFLTGTAAGTNRGSISSAGLWTIGTAASTLTHVANGRFNTTKELLVGTPSITIGLDGFLSAGASTTAIAYVGSVDGLGGGFKTSEFGSKDSTNFRYFGYTNGDAKLSWMFNGTTLASMSDAGLFNITGLTASRAVVTDASKNLVSSAVTSTELGFVSGVTSAIQTQLDALNNRVIVRASQSTTALGTSSTVIIHPTEEEDTHNAYNTSTGEFTIPAGKGGLYRITANFAAAAGATGVANAFTVLRVAVNGTEQKTFAVWKYQVPAVSLFVAMGGSCVFRVSAGDVVTLRGLKDATVGAVAGSGVAIDDWVSFTQESN